MQAKFLCAVCIRIFTFLLHRTCGSQPKAQKKVPAFLCRCSARGKARPAEAPAEAPPCPRVSLTGFALKGRGRRKSPHALRRTAHVRSQDAPPVPQGNVSRERSTWSPAKCPQGVWGGGGARRADPIRPTPAALSSGTERCKQIGSCCSWRTPLTQPANRKLPLNSVRSAVTPADAAPLRKSRKRVDQSATEGEREAGADSIAQQHLRGKTSTAVLVRAQTNASNGG
jgi:hypothetical protein